MIAKNVMTISAPATRQGTRWMGFSTRIPMPILMDLMELKAVESPMHRVNKKIAAWRDYTTMLTLDPASILTSV